MEEEEMREVSIQVHFACTQACYFSVNKSIKLEE